MPPDLCVFLPQQLSIGHTARPYVHDDGTLDCQDPVKNKFAQRGKINACGTNSYRYNAGLTCQNMGWELFTMVLKYLYI